jgi:hypothetical protein
MKGRMNMTYQRSRAVAALAIVVIVAVCVAACGSSSATSSSSSSSSAAAASTGGTANRAKLAACLKQHGVTLPSRPRSGGGYGPPPGSPNGNGNGTANGTTNSNGNGNGGNGNGNGSGNGNGNGYGNSGFGNGYNNGGVPGPGGRRSNNPKLRAAFKACGATAGFRGRGNFRPSSAAITKFASCVKQHGYTLPKPNLTGKGPVYPVSIERNAKFQSASRSCQSMLRPAGGAAPGGGAPPGA